MRRALVLLCLLCPATARAEVLEELSVKTRDGATVHVEVARPDGKEKVPVILTYSPYNSLSGSPAGNLASGDPWVEKGYARAVADVVGTRNSTGCWDYGGPVEQRSGVDLVGALARQPWANGKVAMTGVSYEGTTATMVAAAGDVPGLAAIVPVAAISRWYGYAYSDGVRYLGNSQEPTDEGFDTPLAFDLGFGRTPPDRPEPQALLDRLNPCDAAEHTLRAYGTDPPYDDFWLARDYLEDAARIRVPAFVVHGWQDYNVRQSEGTGLFEAIGNAPFKLAHFMQAPHADGTGDEYEDRLERFFARTLKDERNGVEFEPAVRTQTRTGAKPGDFARETSFPPPGTRTTTVALDGLGSFGDTGTAMEETGSLAWRSAPLEADMRIAGTPVLKLRVSVDTTDGHLTPTLVDIAPDGTSTPITRGFHNLRFRGGLAAPVAIVPGEPIDATVRFSPQDQTIPKGHRIGLVLAGSNVVWAVPVTGPRSFTVASGALELPVVGPVDSTPGVVGPPAAPAAPKGRLTVRIRRSGRRFVRVRGRAPAGSRVVVRLRAGKRRVGRKVVFAGVGRTYSARVRVRGRARAVRAHVVSRFIGGERLTARSRLLRRR